MSLELEFGIEESERFDKQRELVAETTQNCLSLKPGYTEQQVSEEVKKTVGIVERFIRNPQLILEIPRLSLSENERKRFHEDTVFPDTVDDSSLEVRNFLTNLGLHSLSEISECNLTLDMFEGVITFYPRLKIYFDNMQGKPFSLGFLLVALRCEVANQSFIATATARAEKVINHFTPSLRLDNTPITLTDPVFSGPRENAAYLGRTKAGRGVIALEVEQDPFRNIGTLGFDDIVAVVSAVHELVHLKHDELASNRGEGNTFGAIQELGVGDLDVEKHSVTTIDIVVNKLRVSQKTTEKIARHESQKTLYPWIVEGVAVQLEIFLLNELRKMAKKSDRGTADKIQEYINGRFSDLRERNETEMRSYYQGLKMIRLLTKHFSAEEMVSILKDINMEEADKLYAYSPLGMIIQRDPRFLPGLADENVAVRNSLKQSGILPLDLNDVPVNESMSTALASESSVANLTSIALEIGGRIHQLVRNLS